MRLPAAVCPTVNPPFEDQGKIRENRRRENLDSFNQVIQSPSGIDRPQSAPRVMTAQGRGEGGRTPTIGRMPDEGSVEIGTEQTNG